MIAEKDKNVKPLLSIGVSYILQPNVVILDQFQTAADAILEMKKHSSRSVLIADKKQEIIGLVSKTDILYKILSLHKSASRVILEEIMSTPIISVPHNMSVADALAVMENHDIRQVLVSENSKIYGILYREDIVMKLERAIIETNKATKLDSPLCIIDPFASAFISEKKSMLACPHCKAEYKDKDLLSKHVREIHSPAKQ
jgi:signal-transduction protein with cAMP-binding, CBS, and nucleotidyltransferase domain